MKYELIAADILPLADYERIRADKRAAILERKKNRRVAVGPYATFFFENYDTMWLQVQEMLRIEKGGDAQMVDELHAYSPLVPKGKEWIATVMLEIEDPARRTTVLATLGGIEHKMQLRFGSTIVTGEPESDLEYTSPEGKASSVQFVHFRFTAEQIMALRQPGTEVTVAITHPNYGHMAIMSEVTKQELLKDLN